MYKWGYRNITIYWYRRMEPPDYFEKAKKLKRSADKMENSLERFLKYIDAVVVFIEYGIASEEGKDPEPNKIYTMYQDTLIMLRWIIDLLKFLLSQPGSFYLTKKKKKNNNNTCTM